MRLEMSNLNDDLFKRHLSNTSACTCGAPTENAKHFLIECPLYHNPRTQTIDMLSDDVRTNVRVLLFGSQYKNQYENSEILATVGRFLELTKRFETD